MIGGYINNTVLLEIVGRRPNRTVETRSYSFRLSRRVGLLRFVCLFESFGPTFVGPVAIFFVGTGPLLPIDQ